VDFEVNDNYEQFTHQYTSQLTSIPFLHYILVDTHRFSMVATHANSHRPWSSDKQIQKKHRVREENFVKNELAVETTWL
jgi:hypothetical protein